MEFDPLPHAHQHIRLGDMQASTHKWTVAVDYYARAIDCFKAVQSTLHDDHLLSTIQAQITQCEKTIHLCRLKDRSEQAIKQQQAERLSKLTRTRSTSHLPPSTKPHRMMSRHNTIQMKNSGMDSFAACIFPKGTQSTETGPVVAKKNEKHDAHKIEELQMSYEALKTHLKAAFDDIERLKLENNELRVQRETNAIQEQNETTLQTNSDDDSSETELEATL